jgi:hypothetical protein
MVVFNGFLYQKWVFDANVAQGFTVEELMFDEEFFLFYKTKAF